MSLFPACYCVKRVYVQNCKFKSANAPVKLHWFAHDIPAEQFPVHIWIWQHCEATLQHIYQTPWREKRNTVSFFAVTSCIWLVLNTFSTVPEIKQELVARSCELINVLRSAYSTPLYISARLQLWQSIQSAALMNPLQSSWEQVGAASFNWPQSNYYLVKPKRIDR